jgi:hypothetical protein
MSRRDWTRDNYGRNIDPTAKPDCTVCHGRGVLITYPPPSGWRPVEAECYGCIENRDDESKLATEYIERPNRL